MDNSTDLSVAGAGLEPASEAYGASRKTFPNPPAQGNQIAVSLTWALYKFFTQVVKEKYWCNH
jgi:hypothetical protein